MIGHFGFIVAVEDYFDALGKSFDRTDEEWEYYYRSKIIPISNELYKRHEQEWFLSHMCENDIWERKLSITPDQKSRVLMSTRLTHDIDESCPLVIYIDLKCVYNRWDDDNTKSTNIYSLTQILEARDKLRAELKRIEAINPKMYALLKDKEPHLVMVQNNCSDCT